MEAEENLVEVNASSESRPSRFAWGMALGLGVGAFAVVIIVAMVVIVAMVLTSRMTSNLMRGDDGPSTVEYVQSSQRWVRMTDSTHGRVVGVSGGGSSSGGDMEHGAVADFGLSQMTVQDNVPAELTLRIYVTPKTTFSVAGKPWSPKGSGNKNSAEAIFGDSDDADSDILAMKTLAVDFVLEDGDLVAEHVDASREETDFPGFYY